MQTVLEAIARGDLTAAPHSFLTSNQRDLLGHLGGFQAPYLREKLISNGDRCCKRQST